MVKITITNFYFSTCLSIINIKLNSQNVNFHLFNFKFNEKVYVYIPRDYDKDLNVEQSSGNTRFLSDIKLNKLKYNIGSSSGNVKLSVPSYLNFEFNGS